MIQVLTEEHPAVVATAPVPAGRRVRVCHVIHALGVGGAEVLVDHFIRRMTDRYDTMVAVLDEVGEIGSQLRRDGFVVHELKRQPGIDHRCARRLAAFADEQGVDILHAHQYTPFFQAMLSRGFTGRRPVVFTEHGRHVPDLPSRKRMLVNRLLLRSSDRLIGCGQSVATALVQNEGLPVGRVECVYNGVDLDHMTRVPADAGAKIRSEFGIGREKCLAVQVARLHELKDHCTAIAVAADVVRQFPEFHLLIVGDGPERTAVQEAISEHKIAHAVTLAGERHDIPAILSAADTFLLTSISEGIPLTLIEAMAAELPIVATAVGGIPEMVEPGLSGFLAPAGDVQELARGLIQLLEQPDRRRLFGERGAEIARSRFSLEAMLDAYDAVYREVTA